MQALWMGLPVAWEKETRFPRTLSLTATLDGTGYLTTDNALSQKLDHAAGEPAFSVSSSVTKSKISYFLHPEVFLG